MLKLIWNGTLVAIGTVSLVIGLVGVFIPFFPGTPFLLLSIACFALGWFTSGLWGVQYS